MTFLEIVELSNGDIVVRQTDDQGEPMVRVRFSDKSRYHLGSARLDVARHMIQAGIKAINAMADVGNAPHADQAVVDEPEEDDSQGIDVSVDTRATVH